MSKNRQVFAGDYCAICGQPMSVDEYFFNEDENGDGVCNDCVDVPFVDVDQAFRDRPDLARAAAPDDDGGTR